MSDKSALLDQLRVNRTEPVQTKGRRGWLLVAVLIALAIAATAIWVIPQHNVVPIHTAVAQALNAASSGTAVGSSVLDASGYVVAVREASVSAKNIYKVDEVLVQEGQVVKAGQVIARLDDTNTRASLEQAKAQVKQYEAQLASAKVTAENSLPTYRRAQKEYAEGLISAETFESTKATYDAAQAQVAVAAENVGVGRAAVQVNQRLEDDTVVKAPFDGVVTVKNAQPGGIVSPQFVGGGGIAKIVDMNSLEVEVDVSENFINQVRAGQPATITLNAYPEWQIPAEVIAIIPTADRSKATIKVRIRFKEKDARVIPDMGARVSFLQDSPTATQEKTTANQPASVIVPFNAVQNEGDSGIVYVLNDNTVQRRSVRLGSRSNAGQIIISGLEAGATVALGDFSKLGDGSRIRVMQ